MMISLAYFTKKGLRYLRIHLLGADMEKLTDYAGRLALEVSFKITPILEVSLNPYGHSSLKSPGSLDEKG